MSQPEDFSRSRLESAIRTWNNKVRGAYGDLAASIDLVKRKLDVAGETLAHNRSLSSAIVLGNVGANGPEAIKETLERLAVLDRSLTAFHVELRTLHAQAGRAVASADVLSEELLNIQGRQEKARQLGALNPKGTAENDEAREARLTRQIEELRQELVRANEELVTSEQTATNDLLAERDQLRAEANSLRKALESLRGATTPSDRESALTKHVKALNAELLEVKTMLVHAATGMHQSPTTGTPRENLSVETVPLGQGAPLDIADNNVLVERFEQIRSIAYDDQGHRRPMGRILVEAGLISTGQLEVALQEQRSAWNRHLGAILVDLGFVSEEAIAQTLAAQIQAAFVHMPDEYVGADAVSKISGQMARHHTCIPLRIDGGRLVLAMANPFDLIALEDIKLAAGCDVEPVVAAAKDIRVAIKEHYPQLYQV